MTPINIRQKLRFCNQKPDWSYMFLLVLCNHQAVQDCISRKHTPTHSVLGTDYIRTV